MRRIRRYRGRLSAIIWYGVKVGPHLQKSLLLCNLRLAHIFRRRMQHLLAMDGLDTVAVVEEVSLMRLSPSGASSVTSFLVIRC